MKITKAAGREWREWLCVTSVPLVQLGNDETVQGIGSGMMINHAGRRFILAVEHVVKRDATGWALVVQQDGHGRIEYYKPNFFTYIGEIKLSSGEIRFLDLCAAQVSPELETWYEFRNPRGLFAKTPNHVFDTDTIDEPNFNQIYGFSGRVRTEKHGNDTFVSDMVVYPGLEYSHTESEIHHFKLPVPHPGHDAFQSCSGSPIIDFNRKAVALVVNGDIPTDTIQGVAISRVLPNLEFLVSRSGA